MDLDPCNSLADLNCVREERELSLEYDSSLLYLFCSVGSTFFRRCALFERYYLTSCMILVFISFELLLMVFLMLLSRIKLPSRIFSLLFLCYWVLFVIVFFCS